jgi:hypothetical protein
MWQILFFALPPKINAPVNISIKQKYYDQPRIFRPPKNVKSQKLYIKY